MCANLPKKNGIKVGKVEDRKEEKKSRHSGKVGKEGSVRTAQLIT
jgi:hypothetical protein